MWLTLFFLDVLIMLLCWFICMYNHRAGIVDVAWSISIACNILLCYWLFDEAPYIVQILVGLGSSVWFLRLSWHLLRRYLKEKQEDRRYANMRQAMGRWQNLGFFAFFMFQAGLAFLFSFPMLLLLQTPSDRWNTWTVPLTLLAALLMSCALIGEAIADQQLYRFKQDPENHGKTMDQGLWRYSRHPNYFFEWLHWFTYPILASACGLWLLWIYPVLMWLFLYYLTGIPFNERQAIQHRGQNYRDYQQRTSMFIPWKPKQ